MCQRVEGARTRKRNQERERENCVQEHECMRGRQMAKKTKKQTNNNKKNL